METTQEKIASINEFKRRYFPNCTLDRLEETLCTHLNIDEVYQHRLIKSEQDPLTGSIEIAKSCPYLIIGERELKRRIKDFYQTERFQVGENTNQSLVAKRDGKKYLIQIIEQQESWLILID
mgnify:CR=1 FL=1